MGFYFIYFARKKLLLWTDAIPNRPYFKYTRLYGFPPDELCEELHLQNAINNSAQCVQYVPLGSILLLIL